MSLKKVKVLDHVEVSEDGTIFVKELNQIKENEIVISSIPHRSSYTPGSNMDDVKIERVKAIAKAVWTADVIEAYKDKLKKVAASRLQSAK